MAQKNDPFAPDYDPWADESGGYNMPVDNFTQDAVQPYGDGTRGGDQAPPKQADAVNVDFTNAPSVGQIGQGNSVNWNPGFDATKVPNGIPVEWAQDFISRNPGDYSRIGSAYNSPRSGETNNGSGGSRGTDAPHATPYQGQSQGQQIFQPTSTAPPKEPSLDELMAQLKDIYGNQGKFNTDAFNRRTEVASEGLNRQRKSRDATDRSILASRGLIGSGPEQTAQNRMEQDLSDQYSGALSNIYADESNNADQRMMQALQLASGIGTNQASNALDAWKSQNANTLTANEQALQRELGLGQLDLGGKQLDVQKMLGLGNLDLGKQRLGLDTTLGYGNLANNSNEIANQYNLGVGNLGVNQDRLQYDIDHGNTSDLIQILQTLAMGSGISANGRIS